MEQHNDFRNTQKKLFDTLYSSLFTDGALLYAGTLLYRAAHLFPEVIALRIGEHTITYRALYEQSVTLSVHLISRGYRPGDRVIVMFENSIEFYCAYYGVWQTGAVVVPLNTFLHAKELEHVVKDANPAAIVIGDVFYERLTSAALPEHYKSVILHKKISMRLWPLMRHVYKHLSRLNKMLIYWLHCCTPLVQPDCPKESCSVRAILLLI